MGDAAEVGDVGDVGAADRIIEDGVEPTAASVAAAVTAWLDAHWDPDLTLLAWRERLVDAGWCAPTWPERWHGRGLPAWADAVVATTIANHGAVGAPIGVGAGLAGPTIMTHGPDGTRALLLRPLLTGAQTWCQLFSEPGAGSDLAGLTTTATLDGDEWIVNGQKVWNTSAHHADLGLLLARTDWDAPKHRGLTMLAVPMRQPGVEVRPLRQMNEHSSFNEVFLTDARVPAANVIGAVGDGWAVASTTLAYERRFGAMGRPRYRRGGGRTVDEAMAEADAHFATYSWYPQRAGRHDLLVERAGAAQVADDPVVRQQIVTALMQADTGRWSAARAAAARTLGRPPGPEGSVGKLALSRLAQRSAAAHSAIAGASGMLQRGDDPATAVVAEVLVSVPAQSIAGGTDEIQRNILGEKALGLPREPSVDRDTPFRAIAHGPTG